MSKRWTLVRDRALVLQASGIPYETAFNMAAREIPENDPRVTKTAGAQILNEAPRRAALQKKLAARDTYHGHVHRIMREQNIDYPEADRRCRTLFATLVNEMDAELPPATGAVPGRAGDAAAKNRDSMGFPPGKGCPVCNPMQSALFGMSYYGGSDEGDGEWKAAWDANSGTANPVDTLAIFNGLTNYWAGKKSTTVAAAAHFVRGRHTVLAQRMDALRAGK